MSSVTVLVNLTNLILAIEEVSKKEEKLQTYSTKDDAISLK